MLRQLEEYLRQQGRACLSDIALALETDMEAVLPMLELLAAKGRVRKQVMKSKNCGACTRCLPESLTTWEWAGQ